MNYWRCSCGATFEEPGDWSGWTEYTARHVLAAGKGLLEGEHKPEGLFNEAGEMLADKMNYKKAVKEGYLRPKDAAGAPAGGERAGPEPKGTPLKGQMRFITVDLPPELFVLYELARAKFPEEYGQATFAEWLTDCVMALYREHPELGFDVLFGDRPEVEDYKGGTGREAEDVGPVN